MKNIFKFICIVLLLCSLAAGQTQGQYSLSQFIDGMANYQNITIKITDKFMSVRGGCNIHTGYFNVTQNTRVAIGPFSSTDNKCSQDFDSPLLKKLTTSSIFTVQNGILTLVNKDGKSVAKFNRLATSDQTVDINAIIAELKSGSSSTATSSQSSSTQGSSTSGSQQSSSVSSSSATKPQQQTSTGSQTTSNSNASSGSVTIVDTSAYFSSAKKFSFEGSYKPTNLNSDADLLVVFEDGESISIQNGCNMHFGVYTAYENGTLSIGDFFSTARSCKDNFDSSYLEALKKSDNWVRQNKDLIFKNGTKTLLSLAWQQVQSKTDDTTSSSNQGNYYESTDISSTSGNGSTGVSSTSSSTDNTKNASSNNASTKPLTPTVTPSTPTTPAVTPSIPSTPSTPTVTPTKPSTPTVVPSTPSTPIVTPTTPIVPEVVAKQAQQVYLSGEYTTDISLDSDLRVKFDNSTISILNGCNSHNADYKAFDNETITIGVFQSTKKACSFDKDSLYLDALRTTVSWRKIGNQILFKQSSGASNIVLIPYTPVPVALTGKYSTSIPTISNLVMQFTQSKVSIQNGCNIHNADYKAFANGQFSVGLISSTKRQCIVDYDSAYLNALTSASKYQRNSQNTQVTLKNQDGDSTIVLTLIVPSKQVTFSGSFTTDLSTGQSSAVQVKLDSNSITVTGGCNTMAASYQAFENKTLTISDFSNTTNFVCKTDGSKTITDALKSSVSYTQSSDSKITLYDSFNKKTIDLSVAPVARPVTFEGNYTTSIPNDSDLIIKFASNQVSILNGCNSYSGTYEADSLGNIAFKQMAGTLKACSVDFDNLYTKALSNSVYYEASGSKIIFRDINKAETVTLTLLKADFVKLSGKYSTNLLDDSDLLVQFTETNINILNGCNSQSSTYQAFSNGTISIGVFMSTLKFCQNDFDSKYTSALSQSSVYVKNSNNQITLKNASGVATIVLSQYVVPKVNEVTFNDIYKPNLNDDSDLLIKLDSSNKVSITNGCNVQSGTYKAGDDGSISFGPFVSTRKFCQDDKDSVYTNALSNSAKYKVSGDKITLLSVNGQQTLLLTPFVNTTVPVVVIPPVVTPSVPEVKKIIFTAGTYSPSIKNDSDLSISFSSDNKVSILNGCNSYGSSYSAFSNGSVFFSQFSGTQKACRADYDYLYLNALADSYTFTQNKNQITFKDDYGYTTIVLSLVSGSQPSPNNGSSSNSGTTNSTNSGKNQTLPANNNGGAAVVNTDSSTKKPDSVSTPSSQNSQSSPSSQSSTTSTTSEQQQQSSSSTKILYSMTPCLKIFEGYLILNENDPYFEQIKAYLEQDYYYFLKDNTVIAAFKKYRAESIDYQIVFKSIFGTFNAISEYRPANARKILLKSLAIIDYSSLTPSYEGCDTKDLTNRNCITCSKGYSNFKGRCFLVDNKCAAYVADECVKCKVGKVSQGVCVKA